MNHIDEMLKDWHDPYTVKTFSDAEGLIEELQAEVEGLREFVKIDYMSMKDHVEKMKALQAEVDGYKALHNAILALAQIHPTER